MLALGSGALPAHAQTSFPLMPSAAADPDGTLHFEDMTIPIPALMSEEAKVRYIEALNRSLAIELEEGQDIMLQFMALAAAGGASALDAVLEVYPSDVEETEISGVSVITFTPADIPRRNRNRVVMMFNADAAGASLAAVAKMKVIAVHYNALGYPKGNEDIVAVYRELLKTHKPSQIAMVGLSGGCQFAANTTVWLPSQNLPLPGALGLLTCAGGGAPGDSRSTLNGLDPVLSDYTMFGAMIRSRPRQQAPASVEPGQPPREILDVAEFPENFPPSYLLAGTRDMCLSHTVLLHRRLRNQGVVTDLNVWEGMWHAFNMDSTLPETREAAEDIARFLDRHLDT
jgi:hypothetical protein